MGLVAKPEQVFDLPTGQINLPVANGVAHSEPALESHDIAPVAEMLTRKRIREMERDGLLDPQTGALAQVMSSEPVERVYDEVMAETEEPITSSINLVNAPAALPTVEPRALPMVEAPIPATDFFHSLAVNPAARRPRVGLVLTVILLVLAGAGAAAYMLGIFK